jgi:hypothetical protein
MGFTKHYRQQMVVNLPLSESENNVHSFHYDSLVFGGK